MSAMSRSESVLQSPPEKSLIRQRTLEEEVISPGETGIYAMNAQPLKSRVFPSPKERPA